MLDWNKRTYTQEEFTNAWNTSPSIRQVAIKLNLNASGDAYRVLRRAAHGLQLTETHMTGIGLNTLVHHNQHSATPLKKILIKDSTYTNVNLLKRRLIKEKVLPLICALCQKTKWNNQPMPLQLDHINGERDDNRIRNIRLICPNCHALTPTYRGRNKSH